MHLIGRFIRYVGLVVAAYLTICLLGLIPVNNQFRPAAEGIELFVISNPVHADIVVPIGADGLDLRELFPLEHFAGDTSWATHVAIGWGDKGFYIDTPTWSDMKLSTAANALLIPSETCLHVSMLNAAWLPQDAKSVRISGEQLELLMNYVMASFQRDEVGNIQLINGASYGMRDAFYEANGHYHGFNTCNCWVGRALKAGGIRTGWFTPLPRTVTLYFPD